MSLVAYNSSDESGQSDVEDDSVTNDNKTSVSAPAGGGEISDDDEDVGQMPAKNDLLQRDTPAPTAVKSDEPITNLLKGLPAPRASAEGVVTEDALEEEVRPKESQMSDAPKPPPKRQKQPVKISIPVLQNDSDEEEEPAKKKMKPTQEGQKTKGGLFALLPAPVHAAKKETNRILIPHALTKKPAQAKKPTVPQKRCNTDSKPTEESDAGFSKRYTAFGGLTGYDSDSDEETTTSTTANFFSLDSDNKSKVTPEVKADVPVAVVIEAESLSYDVRENVSANKDKESSSSITLVQTDSSDLPAVLSQTPNTDSEAACDALPSVTDGEPSNQDAPLTFRSNPSQANLLSAASMGIRYKYSQSSASTLPYASSYQQYSGYEDDDDQQATTEADQEEINRYMQDEQFLRLQGKKHRGKEEINIIDANMDDFVSSVDVSKNLTEESSYQSHRKTDNNPTHQQRRKKQITYLAYQAKERELELKNSWAQNRMTKKQTQAKYGF